MGTGQLKLRKTVDDQRGVYRIFETTPGVFHVLDATGRTVDEFDLVEIGGGANGVSIRQPFRRKALRPGVPDLARSFAAELNGERQRD